LEGRVKKHLNDSSMKAFHYFEESKREREREREIKEISVIEEKQPEISSF
jgi:hypothetical protein